MDVFAVDLQPVLGLVVLGGCVGVAYLAVRWVIGKLAG